MATFSEEITYSQIRNAAHTAQLDIFGGFHPEPDDPATRGAKTVLMFGPHEPGFWDIFSKAPEYADGNANPLDRWSKRALGELAERFQAAAVFPSDKPFAPFFTWALKTGRAWASPVNLLVHDRAGLMVSYRGALLFEEFIRLPERSDKPCDACAQPCLTACPVGALSGEGYDVDACHAGLDGAASHCLSLGCAVRRACPVSAAYGRVEAQSAFHMKAFHPS